MLLRMLLERDENYNSLFQQYIWCLGLFLSVDGSTNVELDLMWF